MRIRMRKIPWLRNLALGSMLAASLLMALPINALACSGIYVGSQLTANGDTYFGRTEDGFLRHRKVFGIQPATTNSGKKYVGSQGYERAYPQKTYRFSYIRDAKDHNDGLELFHEAGTNELGFSMSATVSTYASDEIQAVDPFTDKGIGEEVIGETLLGEATSARQGCELLASIIEEKIDHGQGAPAPRGSMEGYQIFLSDQNETWLFAGLSGTQYVAFKLPNDVLSINPNLSKLTCKVDLNSDDVIHSANIEKVAQDAGTYTTLEDGSFDIFGSYGEPITNHSSYRYWMGVNYFDPQTSKGITVSGSDLDNMQVEPRMLTFKPTTSGYDTFKILRAFAARGEGTQFDANRDENTFYPIGNYTTIETTVFQIRKNMPLDLATLQWQSLSRAEFSLFLPLYAGLMTEASDVYADGPIDHDNVAGIAKKNPDGTPRPIEERQENIYQEAIKGNKDAEKFLYYTMADINDLARKARKDGGIETVSLLRTYLDSIQKDLIDQQTKADAAMLALPADKRSAKATEVGKNLAEQLQNKMLPLMHKLREYVKAADYSKPFSTDDMREDGTAKTYLSYAALFEEQKPTPPAVKPVTPQAKKVGVPKTADSFNGMLVFALSGMGLAFIAKAAMAKADRRARNFD